MTATKHSALLIDNFAIDTSAPLDALDVEILSAMLPSHPRAFWNGARAELLGGRPAAIQLARLASQDERLLRLSLLSIRSARERRGFRAFEIAKPLAAAAMAHPNKSDAWRSARLSALAPLLREAPIGHIFELLGLASASGRLSCFDEIFAHFPDASGPEGNPRLAPSRASHSWDGMGTPASRMQAFLALGGSEYPDVAAEKSLHPSDPSHPFFWCAARAHHLRASKPQESLQWAFAGAKLLGTIPLPPESSLSGAGWLLLNDPMREALSALAGASAQAAETWGRAEGLASSEALSVEQLSMAKLPRGNRP